MPMWKFPPLWRPVDFVDPKLDLYVRRGAFSMSASDTGSRRRTAGTGEVADHVYRTRPDSFRLRVLGSRRHPVASGISISLICFDAHPGHQSRRFSPQNMPWDPGLRPFPSL